MLPIGAKGLVEVATGCEASNSAKQEEIRLSFLEIVEKSLSFGFRFHVIRLTAIIPVLPGVIVQVPAKNRERLRGRCGQQEGCRLLFLTPSGAQAEE